MGYKDPQKQKEHDRKYYREHREEKLRKYKEWLKNHPEYGKMKITESRLDSNNF